MDIHIFLEMLTIVKPREKGIGECFWTRLDNLVGDVRVSPVLMVGVVVVVGGAGVVLDTVAGRVAAPDVLVELFPCFMDFVMWLSG